MARAKKGLAIGSTWIINDPRSDPVRLKVVRYLGDRVRVRYLDGRLAGKTRDVLRSRFNGRANGYARVA